MKYGSAEYRFMRTILENNPAITVSAMAMILKFRRDNICLM